MRVKLHDTQRIVATDPTRFRILCAGRRWGKSTLAQLIVLKWATEKPGLYWVVSPTYKQSKQIHWRGLQQIVPRDWIAKKNEVELSITLRNGSIIELKGAENPDALRGVKLRGLVIDEIASIRNWDWLWSEVLRPTLTDYEAPALFISTPKGYNHFYELFQMGQSSGVSEDSGGNAGRSDYRSWRFTSYDNPFIPASEIDKARQELTDDVFHQEYLADFRKYTGLVYKDFDRAVHVKELPDFRPVYYLRGLDRGFTNPTAVPIVAVDQDGTWYQTHELYQPGLTNPPLSEALNSLTDAAGLGREGEDCPFELCTMDSANAGDIAELNQLGHDFIAVKKESGESNQSYVRWKIQKFAERLRVRGNQLPRYFVHPRCQNTIREFEIYAWPEQVDGKATAENPLKLNDHMMDALADCNAMYSHFYEPETKKPWEGKVPGTYVRPSPDEAIEDENDWGSTMGTDWNDYD